MGEADPPPARPPAASLDALLPAAIARKAEEAGVAKAGMDALSLLVLAILAGAFIGLGAMAATIMWTGTNASMPFGAARMLGGLVFALGLILVVLGGAELFTGNSLMVMAAASRRIGLRALARAWTIVFIGNMIGAVATAGLVFLAGQHLLAGGAVGQTMLAIGASKVALPFAQAFFLGILCNVLVCLAVWLCYGAHSTTDKLLAILFPIAAFVAAGFEHSVANMYFIPLALIVKWFAADGFWTAIAMPPDAYAGLTAMGLVRNLVPVTLGNIVGGGVLVGLVYWFVYLRPGRGA
jgi:formate/nitrite transporter